MFCGSSDVVRNGHKRGKQLYKCHGCGRQFVGGRRIEPKEVEKEYIEGRQTLNQLAQKHGVCQKTIWNILEGMRHKRVVSKDKDVVIEMDTTYWGRKFGVVIILDAMRNKVLWSKFIHRSEKTEDYLEGVSWLKEHNFKIWGVVCDGLPGLLPSLAPIPAQMCQFHMIAIVKRYLTSKPELTASCELLALVRTLPGSAKEDFVQQLDEWHDRHKDVLNERYADKDGKRRFIRPRLRSAYQSLKRHEPWLWTCGQFSDRVIPNTNASIEILNSRLKTILRVHSGLKAERRQKLLENYIATHY